MTEAYAWADHRLFERPDGSGALLFGAEYAVRKARFGRYGKGPVDRALAAVFGKAAAG